MWMRDLLEKELHILIVEDVAADAVLIERELQHAKMNFSARVVELREEFLKSLREFTPDIILSDYSLPQFDGMTALRLTREMMPSTPFILITGAINEETAVECMKAGAEDYILKDRLARLGSAVQAALVQKRVRDEKEAAEDKLIRSEQRFRALIENSSDVITIFTADGMMKYISPSVERMLGFGMSELAGKQLLPLLHPDDLVEIRRVFIQIMYHPGVPHMTTFRVLHKDGSWRTVEATVNNLLNESGVNGIVGNFRDVTERKRAEEQAKQLQEYLQMQIDRMPIGLIIWDRNFRIKGWNAAATNIFGFSEEEALGKHPYGFIVPKEAQPVVDDIWGRLLEGDLTAHSVNENVTKDGRTIICDWSNTPLKAADGIMTSVLSMVQDITERKQSDEQLRQSHEQLRALAARLQSIREDERASMAREIHDELGQELTALKMDLSALDKKISKINGQAGPALRKKTESMFELIDQTIQTVRRIATELRPGILDDLGLGAAIDWQAQEFQHRTGIKTKCSSCIDDIILDRDRSTAVFRIFQEALTNIARHAKATRVNVELVRDETTVSLEVKDNGRGITQKEISDPKSLGLLGMRERASLLGGMVTISGVAGNGTTIEVKIPLKE